MKNKISDLNNHLFAQLERLGDEELKGDLLNQEIQRGRAIAGIAKEITSSMALTLEAYKLYESSDINRVPEPLRLVDLKKQLQ